MLLLLLSSAFAVDFELSVALPDKAPVHLTFPDAPSGALPRVTFPGYDQGQSYRITVDLSRQEPGQYRVVMALDELQTGRLGRERTTMVLHPTMVVLANEPGTVEQCARVPKADGTVAEARCLRIDILAREGAPAVLAP